MFAIYERIIPSCYRIWFLNKERKGTIE